MLDKIRDLIVDGGGQILDLVEEYWIYILIGIVVIIIMLLTQVKIPLLSG